MQAIFQSAAPAALILCKLLKNRVKIGGIEQEKLVLPCKNQLKTGSYRFVTNEKKRQKRIQGAQKMS